MTITLNGTTGIITPDIDSVAAPDLVGTNFTSLPSGQLVGALPAINGSAITSLSSSNLTGNLPALNGSSLTSLTSANLTGALPAIDGSNLTGIAGTPAGVVIYHAANTAPTGFIKANGASISTSTYSDLFAVIGYTFGGSGGSFNVPDLRGEFLRGWDDGRGVDSGRGFGSTQSGQMQSHNHGLRGGSGGAVQVLFNQTSVIAGIQNLGGYFSNSTATIQNTGGTSNSSENRPRNIALLACIKY